MEQYRHELKYEINAADAAEIRQRLRCIAATDPHAKDGRYKIRSLYFDTPTNRALYEKLDGVNRREKFRIRYYNGDLSRICLEKKSKYCNLSAKRSEVITKEQARAFAAGEFLRMPDMGHPLAAELYRKMKTQQLRAKTIVDYVREPYLYGPGNVRVTLDYDIRTGMTGTDFLRPDCVTVPAGEGRIVLEVKWDAFLPDIIRAAVQLKGRGCTAFSKYAACRIYG